MVYFGIPLRAKAASNNWDNVVKVFNRTLRSITSQTDREYKVIVACHDIPKVSFVHDADLEFIQVDSPIPVTQHEKMLDKGWKVSAIACRVRELGGGTL